MKEKLKAELIIDNKELTNQVQALKNKNTILRLSISDMDALQVQSTNTINRVRAERNLAQDYNKTFKDVMDSYTKLTWIGRIVKGGKIRTTMRNVTK